MPTRGLTKEAAISEVPEDVLRAARSAFDSRQPDAEVADLVYDSLVDGDRGFNDALDVRRLRFEASTLSIDVEVHDVGDDLRLETSVHPPALIEIDLRQGNVHIEARSDRDGHAALEPVQHGLVSMLVEVVRPESAGKLQTAWVRV